LNLARALQPTRPTNRDSTNVLTAKTIEKSSTAEKADAPLISKNRSIKILARSIYRELRGQGYDEKQVVSLATELISEVTGSMSDKRA
jgi:hypothetical protein